MQTRFQALRHLVALGLVVLAGCDKAGPKTDILDSGTPDSGVSVAPRPPGCLVLTPQRIDFGNVVVNTTATKSLTVTNNCGLDVTLTMGALKGTVPLLFSSVPGADTVFTLKDGETQSITVQYTPLVASPTQNQAYFSMKLCSSGTGCEPLVSLRGTAVSTGAFLDPWTLDFCFVPPGRVASLFVTFANIGNAPVHLTADPMVWNTDGGGMTAAGAFQPGVGFPTKDVEIPPYSSIQLPVVFTPPSSDFFTGELDISTDDATMSNITILLSGYGGGAAIACTPPALDFGATATGTSATLKVTCTNVGTDVPGHPEASLFIPAPNSINPGLLIHNGTASFQASFDPALPAGQLLAGQSATIDVTYSPTVPGTETNTPIVSSNDCANPSVPISLSASGVSLPPCDFQITPPDGIAFGHVDQGSTAALPFVIANNGPSDCLVNAIQLTPDSNPAFSLPDYPAGAGPASTTIPAGGVLEVRVQFAPKTAQSVFSGAVSLTISSPQEQHQSINLTGSSLVGCLLIEPSALDFGLVEVDGLSRAWCKSGKRTVTLKNACPDEDVTVGSISVADLATNDGGPRPEFILSGDPSPVTIPHPCPTGTFCPPTTPVTFQVSFEPYAAGKHAAGVQIHAPDGVVNDPYLLALSGDAEQSNIQTDQFLGRSPPALDLLWVVDTDHGVNGQQAIIGDLYNFLAYPMQNGIDLHMATTTTDVYANAQSEDGRMEPCSGCKINGSPVHVVTLENGLDDAVAALARLLNLGGGTYCNSNCNGFGSDGQFLEATYEALSPGLLSGYNQPFYRSEASLAVIIVGDYCEDDYSPGSINFYYNAFIGLKGPRSASRFSLSVVNRFCGTQIFRIPAMVSRTYGTIADFSDTGGTPGWQEELAALWPQLLTELLEYPLSATPVTTPMTIRVTDNGVLIPQLQNGNPQWSYDPLNNAVTFDPSSAPQRGDQLEISYTISCDH